MSDGKGRDVWGVAFTYIAEVEDGRVHGGSVLLRTVSLWIFCGDLYEWMKRWVEGMEEEREKGREGGVLTSKMATVSAVH